MSVRTYVIPCSSGYMGTHACSYVLCTCACMHVMYSTCCSGYMCTHAHTCMFVCTYVCVIYDISCCSGYIADRTNLRYFLSIGMLGEYWLTLLWIFVSDTTKQSCIELSNDQTTQFLGHVPCLLMYVCMYVMWLLLCYACGSYVCVCLLWVVGHLLSSVFTSFVFAGSGIAAMFLGAGYFLNVHHLAYFIVFQIFAGFMQVHT